MILRIENRIVEAPSVDRMRLLGESSSRGNSERIGQFGSGFPYSLALLARHNILDRVKVCINLDVYTFGIKAGSDHSEIYMKKQGGGTIPLNISPQFGAIDWRSVTLAVREFVSNAIDGAKEAGEPSSSVIVETVQDNQDRAKKGTVRVYVPLTPDIEEYTDNIKKNFICLKASYDPDRIMIPNGGTTTRIYRRGVLVREIDKPGLYHYNFPDITINESRIADTFTCEWEVKRALRDAEPDDIVEYLQAVRDNRETYETCIDKSGLVPSYDSQKAKWKEAIGRVHPGRVFTDSALLSGHIQSKGFVPGIISRELLGLFQSVGCKTATDVLNDDERAGRTITNPASDSPIHDVTNRVWSTLERINLTHGKSRPGVKLFSEQMDGGSQTFGFYRHSESDIYINSLIENDGRLAVKVVLEEIGHYVTGAGDASRDFQDWAFTVAANLI